MPKRSLLALPFSLLASLAAISLAAPAGAQSVAIAFEGDPEPGGSGGTYSALRAPVVNDSGVVAFRSSIASGSATSGGMGRACSSARSSRSTRPGSCSEPRDDRPRPQETGDEPDPQLRHLP